jgi:hypothetical protein
MAYGMTAINGISLVVNGQPATDAIPHSVPLGASCSLRVWISLGSDVPEPDVLILHINVKKPDSSLAFSENHEVSLNPGDGAEVPDIGTFTADRSGNWIVNLSLGSLNEARIVATTGDIVFLNVPGGTQAGINNLTPLMALGIVAIIIVAASRKRR